MEKKPNRLYKARLFVMIFEDKRKLLELYNAISGKHYEYTVNHKYQRIF